jgi:hypothetical protein
MRRRLVIHNQRLDGFGVRGGVKILFAELPESEFISDEVINDFIDTNIFPCYMY